MKENKKPKRIRLKKWLPFLAIAAIAIFMIFFDVNEPLVWAILGISIAFLVGYT